MLAGFGIGTTTAWRYIREAVDLLAATAADLATAMARVSSLAYAILDGTLIPIDRVADDRPYYSGKHKRHGLNVQVLADPSGEPVWASPTLPGSVHDLSAARSHGLIHALTEAGVMAGLLRSRCAGHGVDEVVGRRLARLVARAMLDSPLPRW